MGEDIKEEVSFRLEMLLRQGVKEDVSWNYRHLNKVSYSEINQDGHNVNSFIDDNQVFRNILKDVELKYDVYVYYAILASKELILLTVSNNAEQWGTERHNLRMHNPEAYIYDLTNKKYIVSKIKYIINDGCLIRSE